tara:strand:- start:14990 stop:15298 length:309 start_codon:yes stop_codon:yes gene_type:complete
MRSINKGLAVLKKREDELQEAEAKFERRKADSKTYEALCNDGQSLGEQMNDAVREMRSLIGGKGWLENASERWETTRCTVDIKTMLHKQQTHRRRHGSVRTL